MGEAYRAGALGQGEWVMEQLPDNCHHCGAPLLLKNLYVDDGCPCNSGRGVNLAPRECRVCLTANCVKPGHRLMALFGPNVGLKDEEKVPETLRTADLTKLTEEDFEPPKPLEPAPKKKRGLTGD